LALLVASRSSSARAAEATGTALYESDSIVQKESVFHLKCCFARHMALERIPAGSALDPDVMSKSCPAFGVYTGLILDADPQLGRLISSAVLTL
jgi:hypothetical protein